MKKSKPAFIFSEADEEIILIKSLTKDQLYIFQSCLNQFSTFTADIDSISKAVERNIYRFKDFKKQLKNYPHLAKYTDETLSLIEETIFLIRKELKKSAKRRGFSENSIRAINILNHYIRYKQPTSLQGRLKTIENPTNYTYAELMDMLGCNFKRARFVSLCSLHKIKSKDSYGIKKSYRDKLLSIDTSKYTIDELMVMIDYKNEKKWLVKLLNVYKLKYKESYKHPCSDFLLANAEKLSNMELNEIKTFSNYPLTLAYLGTYLRENGIKYKIKPFGYISNTLKEKIHLIDDTSKYTVNEIFEKLEIDAVPGGKYLNRLNIPFKKTK